MRFSFLRLSLWQEFILRRAHSSSAAHYGGNSVARTVVTYLKGMVGSYVL